jgi:hydrogenase maturation protease
VFDAGTAVLDVLLDAAECRKIVIIDAVCSGGEPGTIYRLPFEGICSEAQQPGTSLHEISLLGSLEMARLQMRRLPEIVIIGVEPREVGVGTELSSCVQDKLQEILATVLEEVVR